MKTTKKQRKITTPPNTATMRSIQLGKRMSAIYCGANPEFTPTFPNGPTMPPVYVKTKAGVPYVNLTLRQETLE